MKKIILTLAVICSAHTATKAQQNDILPRNSNDILTPKKLYPQKSNMALLDGKTSLNNNYPAAENGPAKDHDYYAHKSRNQRIIGWSLLGGGLVLSGVGVLLVSSTSQNYNNSGKDNSAVVMFGLGAAAGLTSIPFMILAYNNKTKARAQLSGQKTFIPGKADKYITGLTVSIPIGK